MNRGALHVQEVSGVYKSPFLDTDELKMALKRGRKVSGDFVETGSRPALKELIRRHIRSRSIFSSVERQHQAFETQALNYHIVKKLLAFSIENINKTAQGYEYENRI